MPFTAGQYLQLLLPGSERAAQPLYRAYSNDLPPSRPALLSLLVARAEGGLCSAYVFERLNAGGRDDSQRTVRRFPPAEDGQRQH